MTESRRPVRVPAGHRHKSLSPPRSSWLCVSTLPRRGPRPSPDRQALRELFVLRAPGHFLCSGSGLQACSAPGDMFLPRVHYSLEGEIERALTFTSKLFLRGGCVCGRKAGGNEKTWHG